MMYLGNDAVALTLVEKIPGTGEFTKYQKMTVTPTEATRLKSTHTLGIEPKVIIVTIDETLGSSSAYLEDGIFGDVNGAISTGDRTSNRSYKHEKTTSVIGHCAYYWDNTYFDIYRASSANNWSTTSSYTVELYA